MVFFYHLRRFDDCLGNNINNATKHTIILLLQIRRFFMKKQTNKHLKAIDNFPTLTSQELEHIEGGANWFLTLIDKLKANKNILP